MQTLRVVTLNIWNRQGPWEARRALIRRGLSSLAPDVVVLQEVLRMGPPGAGAHGQHDELAEGEFTAGELRFSAYGPAWTIDAALPLELGNAVLSRFPIARAAHTLLPNPMQHETRGVLFTLIDTPAGLLPVFTTHLDWQLELSSVRCIQVRALADLMDGWLAESKVQAQAADRPLLPAVLGGDLNAEPDSDEVRFLRGLHTLSGPGPGHAPRSVYFADCFAHCAAPAERDGGERGATFARSNRFAAREYEPDRRIDYVFVARPDKKLRGEPVRSFRCFTESEGGVFPSDHYGVAADLYVAPRDKPLL